MSNIIPSYSILNDQQIITVPGPDGLSSSYSYDAQTRSLQRTDCSTAVNCKHGSTHIGEDAIPNATCDSPGLMSADDKCRVDSFIGTRIGVLGFQGSGFPDDGGFLDGPVIFAAGSDFITLERVGNIIRFNVEIPIPLRCDCDEGSEIYLVQDTTDINKVRPSNCSGKIPGMNLYSDFSAYLIPVSAASTAEDVNVALQSKDQHPAMIFKRSASQNGLGEFHLTLQRTSPEDPTTNVGWVMTPGPDPVGQVTNVFFMGRDNDNSLIRFDFIPEREPGLLGGLYYKGNLITKQMAVITGYTQSVIADNRYFMKKWDTLNSLSLGDSFTARNVWNVQNPENPTSGTNPQSLSLDSTIELLKIGTLVELFAFQIAETNGIPTYRYFFSKEPQITANNLYSSVDCISFGNELISRDETFDNTGTNGAQTSIIVSDIRNFEKNTWGLTGYDEPLIFSTDTLMDITGGGLEINPENRAKIDPNIPGLIVKESMNGTSPTPIRPIFLWNRTSHTNFYSSMLIGRPESSSYAPIDILVRAPIDSWETKFVFVSAVDSSAVDVGGPATVSISGVNFHDIPPTGTFRILTPDSRRDLTFDYSQKMVKMSSAGYEIILIGYNNKPTVIMPNDALELVHQDYNSQVVRLEWVVEPASNIQRLTFKVGNLNTGLIYDFDENSVKDDFVSDLDGGYATSAVYSQSGFFAGVGTKPETSPEEFVIFDGGGPIGTEFWNELEIMVRDNQLWIWWNKALIPPNQSASASLPTPINIDTPYFPVNQGCGKFGLRMFPGALIRSVNIKSQITKFNEFINGNIKII